jgi:hypothetical protein
MLRAVKAAQLVLRHRDEPDIHFPFQSRNRPANAGASVIGGVLDAFFARRLPPLCRSVGLAEISAGADTFRLPAGQSPFPSFSSRYPNIPVIASHGQLDGHVPIQVRTIATANCSPSAVQYL